MQIAELKIATIFGRFRHGTRRPTARQCSERNLCSTLTYPHKFKNHDRRSLFLELIHLPECGLGPFVSIFLINGKPSNSNIKYDGVFYRLGYASDGKGESMMSLIFLGIFWLLVFVFYSVVYLFKINSTFTDYALFLPNIIVGLLSEIGIPGLLHPPGAHDSSCGLGFHRPGVVGYIAIFLLASAVFLLCASVFGAIINFLSKS